MVKIQPEILHIKAKYFGDNNRIADEQAKLYKKERYNPLASIIPLFIQIILLIGVIHVIYHPLDFLLGIDSQLSNALIEKTIALTNYDPNTSSIQLSVVQTIKNPEFFKSFLSLETRFPDLDLRTILRQINDINMSFFGVNLGWIPIAEKGLLYLVPVLAGFSAWLLSFTQNNLNVLQAEQGKFNKYFTMALSVGLSVYLGLFVPVGVALYWISSNTIAILKLLILNKIIDPRKTVDYVALEASKKELAALQNLERNSTVKKSDITKRREKADYKKFFSIANKHLVFFSESSGYYKYFSSVIRELLACSNVIIHYITNDPKDQIFDIAQNQPRIKPYYIGMKRLITLMMKMDAKLVVMTTPDLGNFHIKRSYIKNDVEYIYMPHSPGGSYSKTLRKGALDHFDTIFLTGPQAKNEIRALEEVYGLPIKNLVEFGFPLIEEMSSRYESQEKETHENKIVMIAPSWHDGNIMECCIEPILDTLVKYDFIIVVRPHPQYMLHFGRKVEMLQEKFSSISQDKLIFETDFSSSSSIYQSDILVTDWSGIGMEFCYATLKPGIFINTKRKIMNPEHEKITLESLEDRIRKKMGIELELSEIQEIGEKISYLVDNADAYRNAIEKIRNEELYNYGSSAKIGAEYLIKQLIIKRDNDSEKIST
jgi:YidC/Oxa1 family membrane protein insertase